MASTMVDSSVLLDVITQDAKWFGWSSAALETEADRSILLINQVIYAEVSIRFATIEELEAVMPSTLLQREGIPFEAAFLAGKCFLEYRKRGGVRPSTLPDFFIGAHAAVAGHRLITRDAARYRTYFPRLELICPV